MSEIVYQENLAATANYLQGGDKNISNFVEFWSKRFKLNLDSTMTYRQSKLHILKLFYTGEIYRNLQPWYQEYYGGNYVKLIDRAPCIIYKIAKIIVEESTAMLFGQEHFPCVVADDSKANEFLVEVTDDSSLNYSMLNAAREGAIGSVCIIVKILNGKFYFEVLDTGCLTPVFEIFNPNELKSIVEKKRICGETLKAHGYEIAKDNEKDYFWVVREFTKDHEVYYIPVLDEGEEKIPLVVDEERTVLHDFGDVPAFWIKNTPCENKIDGGCTYEDILEMIVEIDYQMSQLSRLLRVNSDPTLVIKDASNLEGSQLVKGVGDALMLGKDGDAYLLEITNASTKSVIDYVRCLREFAVESVRGNRANPDKMSAIHSGKALQMLNAPMISFVEELRICYAEKGLLQIYKRILKIAQSGKYKLDYKNADVPKDKNISLKLDYKDWYPESSQDQLQDAQTLQTLVSSDLLSRETAIKKIADKFNIVDVEKELILSKNNDISPPSSNSFKQNSVERGS